MRDRLRHQHTAAMLIAWACLLLPIEPVRADELDDAVEAVRSIARQKISDAERFPRTIHVSSAGSDANPGTAGRPFQTIRAAAALIRDGSGDSLLLRRGDTFPEGLGDWSKSGKSIDEAITVGAWGDPAAPRPIVTSRGHNLVVRPGVTVRHLRLTDLHLAPEDAPFQGNRYGVWVRGAVIDLVAERCRIERYHYNVSLSSEDLWSDGVTVRGCRILDAQPGTSSNAGQGMFAGRTRGLLVEDTVFDHNGWIPGGGRHAERHNLYLAGLTTKDRTEQLGAPAVVRRCVFIDGSSHGVQLRAGGTVEDCLFIDNANHCLVSGETAVVRGNVLLGGAGTDLPRPRPLGFGITAEGAETLVEGNVVADKPVTNPNSSAALHVGRGDHWDGPIRARLSNNAVLNWHGNGLEVSTPAAGVAADGNVIGVVGKGRKVVTFKAMPPERSLAGNLYHHADEPPARWFVLWGATEARYDLAGWAALTGDTSAAGVAGAAPRVPTVEMRQALRDGALAPIDALTWSRSAPSTQPIQ